MSTRTLQGTKPAPGAPPAAGSDTPRLVPAVERAVRLIDHLAGLRRPQPLAELSKALAMPKSSLHGLLHTLVALGLASRDERGEYALGARPLQWAGAFAGRSGMVDAFDAVAGQVSVLREEAIMLAVLDGADVLYLACRPGTRALAVNFRVGGRFPAHCTSSGKALLATLPEARVRELLGGAALPRLTRHSVGSTAALLRQLARFRAQGYAVDDEETADGMHCFGAPVFAAGRGEAVAAVAVSLIKASTSVRRRDEVIAAIRELAARVSQRLGYRP
ncbi:MAG: IclR family transcriptional regulator [Burkholderiaceae bacterium]|nr:IclR family transcriptional regulator [Burkholderiaceae bacterium]